MSRSPPTRRPRSRLDPDQPRHVAADHAQRLGLSAERAYVAHWLPGALLTGIGVGMVLPSLSAAAVAHLPPARFGIGSAVNQAIRQIGSVLGVALAVALLGRHATLAQFETVYHAQLGLAVATALFALPVDTRPKR